MEQATNMDNFVRSFLIGKNDSPRFVQPYRDSVGLYNEVNSVPPMVNQLNTSQYPSPVYQPPSNEPPNSPGYSTYGCFYCSSPTHRAPQCFERQQLIDSKKIHLSENNRICPGPSEGKLPPFRFAYGQPQKPAVEAYLRSIISEQQTSLIKSPDQATGSNRIPLGDRNPTTSANNPGGHAVKNMLIEVEDDDIGLRRADLGVDEEDEMRAWEVDDSGHSVDILASRIERPPLRRNPPRNPLKPDNRNYQILKRKEEEEERFASAKTLRAGNYQPVSVEPIDEVPILMPPQDLLDTQDIEMSDVRRRDYRVLPAALPQALKSLPPPRNALQDVASALTSTNRKNLRDRLQSESDPEALLERILNQPVEGIKVREILSGNPMLIRMVF